MRTREILPRKGVVRHGTLFILIIIVAAAIGASSIYYWQQHRIGQLNKQISTINHTTSSTAQSTTTSVPPTQSPFTPIADNGIAHDFTIPPVTNGMVAVISRIPTKAPVVFLTIDDGIVQDQGDAQLMVDNNIKATFFLVHRFILNDPSFFANLATKTGSLIEDHTYDHFIQTNLTYAQQQQDICSNADALNQWFGRRPVLYRPPGGDYNLDSEKAAASCNMQALVLWDVTVNNGALQYQVGHALRPGDIVLMHFRTTFSEDLGAFVTAMKSAGLTTDLLENWLPQAD